MNTTADIFEPPVFADANKTAPDLVEKYRDQISKMGEYINEENPKYVLALSRSGPRILEFFEQEGVINLKPQIITEKSLPFLDEAEINDSDFIVFDDVIIAGTTLWTRLTEFTTRYEASVEVVTLATDCESAGLLTPSELDCLPDEKATIRCGPEDDQKEVTLRSFVELDRRERFRFSKEVVQAVSRLNKPYDVDFALLNTVAKPDVRATLRERDDVQELTTKRQRESDLERYSLIVPNEITYAFQRAVFGKPQYQPRISKLRIYRDRRSGEINVVPMFLFSMEENVLKGDSIFDSERFDELNRIVDSITETYLQAQNGEEYHKARFRLTWYLVSYLFGRFVDTVLEDEGQEVLSTVSPQQHLCYDDIAYLFGPEASRDLIRALESYEEDLKADIQAIDVDGAGSEFHFEIERPDDFDDERWKTYREIEDDLEAKLSDHNSLQGNVAIIFEQLYTNVEMNAQSEIEAIEGDFGDITGKFSELVERLNTGFTVSQLAGILSKHTDTDFRKPARLRQLSLTTDILVDRGEQIPFFHRDDENELWERAYRHGENAFVLYEEFRSVMSHLLNGILNGRSLRPVALEKIVVLLWKSMCDRGLADDLYVPNSERRLWIQNTFLPFGHTLDIVHEASDETLTPEDEDIVLNSQGNNFVQWAKDSEGLIEEDPHSDQLRYRASKSGLRHETSFPEFVGDDSGPDDVPSLKYHEIKRMKTLARVLVWIHTEIDPSSDGEYLIGLTSCTDRKTYLHALREEFRAMFDSKEEDLGHVIAKLDGFFGEERDRSFQASLKNVFYGSDEEESLPTIDRLPTINRGLRYPWKQAETKLQSWDEMEARLDEITESFRDHGSASSVAGSSSPDLYSNSELPEIVEQIRDRHSTAISSREVKALVEFTEIYAKVCVAYCKALWAFYGTCRSLLVADSESWTESARDFNEAVDRWEDVVQELSDNVWVEKLDEAERRLRELDDIPRIDVEKLSGTDSVVQERQLESVFTRFASIYETLSEVYELRFTRDRFEDQIESADSSIWRMDGQFLVSWEASNCSGEPYELRQRLNNIQPDIQNPGLLRAEDTEQLRESFKRILRMTHNEDERATLTLGIASVDDVGGRINVDEYTGQVDSGNHLHLAKRLNEAADTHHQNVRQSIGGDSESSVQSTVEPRFHTVCITSSVRNAWGGVLPSEMMDEINVYPPNEDAESTWSDERYKLKDTRELVSKGCCAFSPTESFLTEDATLSEFED